MRNIVGCLMALWLTVLCLPSSRLLADEVKDLIEREGALQKALQQLKRRDFSTASSQFESVAKFAPKGSRQRVLALLGLAEIKKEEAFHHILSGRGYPKRIKLAYEEVLKEAERSGDPELVAAALLRLGDFESSWENWKRAREIYNQVIAFAPKSPIAGEAYVKLGQTYANFFEAYKNEDIARKFFEKAATDYPNTFSEVLARYELGLQAVRQKKFQEAIAQLSRASEIVRRQPNLTKDPEAQHQKAEADYLLGLVLAKVGQKQAAISAFEEAGNKYRGNFPLSPINRQVWLQAHIQKSLCLQQLGRGREAINTLEEFINSNPDHFLSRRAQLILLRIKESMKPSKVGLNPQPPQKLLVNLKNQNGKLGNECGLRALWAAIQVVGKKVTFDELRERMGSIPKQGLSMRELLKLADSVGVEGFVIKASDAQSILSVGTPIVAHLVNNHFVTVLSASGTTFKLYDPSLGIYDLPISEFQKQWSGFALVLGSERKRLIVESTNRLRYVSERESARIFGTQDPIGCVNHVGCDPIYAPLDDPCACNLDDLPELMGSPAPDFPYGHFGPGRGSCRPIGNTGHMSCVFPILLSSPTVQVGVRSGQAVSQPWDLLEGVSVTPRFVFALIYNNFETQEGPFGNIRWSYGIEGFVNGDTVQIVDWRGNRLYYQQLVDGSYLTPQGHIGFELREVSNGSGESVWVWKHIRSGVKFVFKVEPTPPGGGFWPPEEGAYASYRLYLAEIQDRNGNKLVINYQWGSVNNMQIWRPISATDPSGGTWQFYYHPNSFFMSQVIDPVGNSVTFQWQEQRDSQNRVTWRTLIVTDLAGSQWKFDFDIGRLLTKIENPFGGEVRYEHINIDYGHFVGLIGVILPNGFKKVFAWTHPEPPEGYEGWTGWQQTVAGQEGFVPFYDAFGNPTYYRRVTQYLSSGVLQKFWIERRTIEGHRSVTEYDFDGLPVRTVDELGREWKFSYHPTGQPTQVIDPMGRVTQYTYDSEGKLLSVTDQAGRTTQYVYDERGNLVQIINPLGLSRYYTYNSKGLKTSETDALGNTTHYEYDQRGLLVKTIDPLGNITQYQRDALGRVTAITDPTGNTVYYSYDSAGRVTQITYPDGTNEQFVYNCCALVQKIDANGNVVKYEYDKMGRLVKEIDPLGRETRYEYDLAGRKVAEIDAKGRMTKYAYDKEGRLIEVTFPDGTKERYEYDAVGNRVAVILPNGAKRIYIYDPLNRLVATILRR